jgi:hypothetical protein
MARKRNSKNRGCAAALQKNFPTEWKKRPMDKNPLVVFLSVGRCYSDVAYFLPEKIFGSVIGNFSGLFE